MHSGRIVLAQFLDFLPRHEFQRCVRRYPGPRRLRSFSCFDQFLAIAFGQISGCDSLREIVLRLGAMRPKLYHAGWRTAVARSTLADANETRSWRIFADFAQVLIRRARALYAADDFGVALKQAAYAFDSTTIDLCLSLFPWAHFRRRKGGVKLHTLIDLHGSIPCFVHVTPAGTHDVTALDELVLEPGAFYVMDRGYIDFQRLHRFVLHAAFFVVRAKRDLDFGWRASRPVDLATGLRSEQTIVLRGPKSSQRYPDPLRRIAYVDAQMQRRFVFLTNNFTLPALTIAQLYRCRWNVELFFRWIKQNLRIRSFYGTSANAVKTQVWTALAVYALVAIAKKELGIRRSLGEILSVLSVTLFEKTPISLALNAVPWEPENGPVANQLNLFES